MLPATEQTPVADEACEVWLKAQGQGEVRILKSHLIHENDSLTHDSQLLIYMYSICF